MLDFPAQRPTWAEINLDNLAFNFKSVKKFVGADVRYMAVVKADAYGHGSIPCSRRLEKEGIDWFGVALPEEGVELRHAGIRKLILCLGSFWPGQETLILNNNLTPVIYQLDRADLLDRAAKTRGTVADVHIKIDTGMGRIGVRYDQIAGFADRMKAYTNLRIEGLMTHFASADDLASDFTSLQTTRFNEACSVFRERGFRPAYTDLANSPGAIAHPDARSTMVRLGGVLYGLGDDVLPRGIALPELRPVMSLHSRIAHLKSIPAGESVGYGRTFIAKSDTRIATIPIGYQDGYSRALSNVGRVIVNGQYAPIAGRISMDWITVDVTEITDVRRDDEVILIGSSGVERVTAEELAVNTGSISYEITCGIHRRVPRHFMPEA
jgi:alanine racemase